MFLNLWYACNSQSCTHSSCVHCSFWQSLLFWACFAFTICNVCVKCSYFQIFSGVNWPYFSPHTIPYSMFKFSAVPHLHNTVSHNADTFMLTSSQDVSLGRLCFDVKAGINIIKKWKIIWHLSVPIRSQSQGCKVTKSVHGMRRKKGQIQNELVNKWPMECTCCHKCWRNFTYHNQHTPRDIQWHLLFTVTELPHKVFYINF